MSDGRGRTSLLVLLGTTVVLGGCDLVFPLDDPPTPIDAAVDAAVDASPDQIVRVRWHRQSVGNDSTGAAQALMEPAGATLTAFALDGTPLPVISEGMDELVFAVANAGDRYRVVRTEGDETIELQDDAMSVDAPLRRAGRLMRGQPLPVTTVKFTRWNPLGPDGSTGYVEIASTGLWTRSTHGKAATAVDWELDWNSTTSLSGPLGLLDAGHHDKLFYSVFDQSDQGLYHLARVASAFTTLRTGEPIDFDASMLPQPVTGCVSVMPHLVAENEHVARASPNFSPASSSWELEAVPDPDHLGGLGGLGILKRDDTSDEGTQAYQYGNPFGGSLLASMTVARSRKIEVPSQAGTPITIYSGARTWAPVEESISQCPSVELMGGLAIPQMIKIDNVQIHDASHVSIGGATTIEVSWGGAGNLSPDYYEVVLSELRFNPGQGVLVPQATFVTDREELEVPVSPEMRGKYFVLTITAYRGFPNVDAGDYLTLVTDKLATATTTMPFFLVTP